MGLLPLVVLAVIHGKGLKKESGCMAQMFVLLSIMFNWLYIGELSVVSEVPENSAA